MSGTAIPIETPIAGFYKMQLAKGGYPVGIRIWHGQPKDPVTGELMDRSLRWQAEANGRPIEINRVWPACAGSPISPHEATYLANMQEWGERNAPGSPQANPRKRIDLISAPLPL